MVSFRDQAENKCINMRSDYFSDKLLIKKNDEVKFQRDRSLFVFLLKGERRGRSFFIDLMKASKGNL